ncbi:hypothetical protein ACS0TY_031905 [Phlomoides rotata]
MVDGTRLKDLQEQQKALEQLLQTESLKWEATEAKIQDSIHGITTKVDEQCGEIMGKLDHLTNTLASLQLQIMSDDRGKGQVDRESSLLGDPTYGSSSRNNNIHRQIQEQTGQVVHSPLPRLDFPRFNGSNLRGWILNAIPILNWFQSLQILTR